MKKIFTLFLLLFSFSIFSQEDKLYNIELKNKTVIEAKGLQVAANYLNYVTTDGNSGSIELVKIEKIDGFEFYPNVKIQKITHEDFHKNQLMERLSEGSSVGIYIDINIDSYKKGDTLIIGKPSGISSNYNQATGLTTKLFETIMYGTSAGTLLKGVRFAEDYVSGQKIVIDEIILSKRVKGVYIYAIPVNEKLLPIDKYLTVSLDRAILTKEIINPKAKLTKESAIELLKEKKELLDLGLISQEEYDKLKNELSPIILKK